MTFVVSGLPALLVALLLGAGPGTAQEPPDTLAVQESLEEAHRLQDAGEFGAAADRVRAYLQNRPDDAGAHWLLGQLLHWSGEHRAARRAYEEARGLGLEDPWLEIEHASVLMALEAWAEAREVLRPVAERGPPEARNRARTMLGTLAYWEGDLSEATRLFRAALDENPENAEAASRLREILELTRPWVRTRLEGLHDTQSLGRYRLEVEGGTYLHRLWAVVAGGTPRVVDADAPRASGTGWVELRGFLPELRLDARLRGGGVWAGSTGMGGTWIGRAALAFRLPEEVELAGAAERERYLWTRSSADTLLVTHVLDLALDRADAPGWAGRVGLRRETFSDGNAVRRAYGWALAPVGPQLRLGYAFSWADSDESTWVPASGIGPGGPPGLPGGGTSQDDGVYDPYFTPENSRTHSLLAELSGPLADGTARLSGEWGFRALEDAPTGTGTGSTSSDPTFFEREFTPWSVTAAWTAPVGSSVTVDLRAERRQTAFYRLTRVEVGLVHHFSSAR